MEYYYPATPMLDAGASIRPFNISIDDYESLTQVERKELDRLIERAKQRGLWVHAVDLDFMNGTMLKFKSRPVITTVPRRERRG